MDAATYPSEESWGTKLPSLPSVRASCAMQQACVLARWRLPHTHTLVFCFSSRFLREVRILHFEGTCRLCGGRHTHNNTQQKWAHSALRGARDRWPVLLTSHTEDTSNDWAYGGNMIGHKCSSYGPTMPGYEAQLPQCPSRCIGHGRSRWSQGAGAL